MKPDETATDREKTSMVIVLAAGRGERFLASGGATHKLDAELGGKTVLEHVMQTVKRSGFAWHLVRPAGYTAGIGHSIAMGVRATACAGRWLVLPGDLPLVRAESLLRVAAALDDWPVVVPSYLDQSGHPVGFRAECFEALAALSGDVGAASVVRCHRARGEVFDLPLDDAGIVTDVDTLDDLQRAEYIARKRS